MLDEAVVDVNCNLWSHPAQDGLRCLFGMMALSPAWQPMNCDMCNLGFPPHFEYAILPKDSGDIGKNSATSDYHMIHTT